MTICRQLRASLAIVAAFGLGTFFENNAAAQSYPTRVIKFIVPFPAGGPTDVMGRMITERLAMKLGPIIVENRPGAGGVIGSKAVVAADADGHTLLFGSTGTLAISPALYAQLDYDPVKAFTPIAMVAEVPYVLVVHPSVPAKSIGELVAYAKANSGKLNSGATNATPPHIACEMFKSVTGSQITHVAYRGGPQAINDLLGGHVQLTCDQTTVLLPHIEAGNLRPLAVFSAARLKQLGSVPTMVESGYRDLVVSGWFGVVAPAGTPSTIVERLNREINTILRSPEFKEVLAKFGAEPLIGSPQDFAAFLNKEIPKWGQAAKASGAKIE